MKNYWLFIPLILVGALFSQCNDDKYDPEMFKPDSHGDPGKILIVLEKEYWGTELEDSVINKFERPIASLPQPEKTFSLEIAPRKAFTQGLKTLHTIVIFEIGNTANNKNARMEAPTKDLWAKNQTIYKIRAVNQQKALEVFNNNADDLIKKLNDDSRNKLMTEYQKKKSKQVAQELSKIQKVELIVPSTMKILENQQGFAWLKQYHTKWEDNTEHEIQQGILIYTYPYEDSATFSYDFQVNKRDSILKYSVPGPSEGSYMATEKNFGMEPIVTEKEHDGGYLFEMRGLWKVEGDLMGGPFVSISAFDEPNNRIVTIEGYVYAPHFDKRELIREMEAMIYSYHFVK